MNTEDALKELLKNAANERVPSLAYYDKNVLSACRRFESSDEWSVTLALFERYHIAAGKALDVGAGNGIASYALARAGWQVIALEPDSSNWVGNGAIRRMVRQTGLPVSCVTGKGERLRFADGFFDLVYARQVLHHAANVEAMCKEMGRVTRSGGWALICREHVAEDAESLQAFLANHPLHAITQAENAYPLSRYLKAMRGAFRVVRVWGPWDTMINVYPDLSREQYAFRPREALLRQWGRIGAWMARLAWVRREYWRRQSVQDKTPGRVYSFLLRKK